MKLPSGYTVRELQQRLKDHQPIIAKRAADKVEFRAMWVTHQRDGKIFASPLNGSPRKSIIDAWPEA